VGNRHSILTLAFWCLAIYLWVALGLFAFKSALLTMAVYHFALCGGGWFFLRPKLQLRFSLKHIGAAALALIAGFALTWFAMEFLLPLLPPSVFPVVTTYPLNELGMNARSYLLIALYFGLINPLAEEAFWRGRILPTLTDARSPAPNLMHAVIFAGYHLIPLSLMFTQLWLPAVAVLIGGCIFGIVVLRTRGLLVPLALHFGVNAYLLIWFGRFIAMGS
jgi:membrane protease YdiL (CAAX protease family)